MKISPLTVISRRSTGIGGDDVLFICPQLEQLPATMYKALEPHLLKI